MGPHEDRELRTRAERSLRSCQGYGALIVVFGSDDLLPSADCDDSLWSARFREVAEVNAPFYLTKHPSGSGPRLPLGQRGVEGQLSVPRVRFI